MKCNNLDTPRIYVAATRQNDGKTTASIGLMGILASKFKRLGFIKPVGQRYVEIDGHRIDADAVLMREAYNCENEFSDMSPLAVDRQFTRRYIDNPTPDILEKNICNAFDNVAENKDISKERAQTIVEIAADLRKDLTDLMVTYEDIFPSKIIDKLKEMKGLGEDNFYAPFNTLYNSAFTIPSGLRGQTGNLGQTNDIVNNIDIFHHWKLKKFPVNQIILTH